MKLNEVSNRVRPIGVALALSAVVTSASTAGVIDSPIPALPGAPKSLTVFYVPGVVKNNNLETAFACTSLERSGFVVIGIEVFASPGCPPLNDVTTGDGVETLGLGETATIATGATVAIHEDEVIDTLGPASVKNGSARILSSSKKIACSVFVLDELNDPPSSMVGLSVISKKQRGD